ncbi:uncharacterized protein B0H18DRAFT_1215311 [Fomitopsis serialis]|uniref:uncharacterized protein n=1 Tax=Fomitopsis serialis TaxID=139415 RepID=UPI002007A56B|nr:uncharacterized protein B0H18DRAFT_1215311 [Neoantrodia serialis]KAH9915817.1 hypothetical protein B0H18DRAFT_1215311 [Neoantrodia serialis]
MVNTRPSNASKHPGNPDLKNPRRPSSELVAERLEAEQEQAAEAATQAKKLVHVAKLQNTAHKAELKRAKVGNKPSTASQSKTKKPSASGSSAAKSTSTRAPAVTPHQPESTILPVNQSTDKHQSARKSTKPGRDAITETRELLSASGQQSRRTGTSAATSASGKGTTVTSVKSAAAGGSKRKAPDNNGASSESARPKQKPAKKSRTKAPAGVRPDWSSQAQAVTPSKATTTPAKQQAISLPRAAIQVAREWSKLQPPQVKGSDDESGPPGEVLNGGYASDDDDETAAPEKGDVRTTAEGIVTITHNSSGLDKGVTKGRKRVGVSHYKNEDLPAACRKLWRNTYVPTMYDMYATGNDPWDNTANNRMVGNLTYVWEKVYNTPVSSEDIRGPILGVMNQRLAEWRNKLAAAAINVVVGHFEDGGEQYSSPESRAKFVKWALGPKKLFIWQATTPKRTGAFQSSLIIKTFATHLTEVQGTVGSFFKGYEPQGALALTCVALERALMLFETGVHHVSDPGDTKRPEFNASIWYDATDGYQGTIAQLKPEVWDAIIAAAEPYAKKGKARRLGHSASSDCDMGPEDDRARLLDSSDLEEDDGEVAAHSEPPNEDDSDPIVGDVEPEAVDNSMEVEEDTASMYGSDTAAGQQCHSPVECEPFEEDDGVGVIVLIPAASYRHVRIPLVMFSESLSQLHPESPPTAYSDLEALGWKQSIRDYIAANRDRVKGAPSDNIVFYELYQSPAQLRARTHPALLATQSALLSLWHNSARSSSASGRPRQPTHAPRLLRSPPHPPARTQRLHPRPARRQRGVERWEDPGFRACFSKILEHEDENGVVDVEAWRKHDAFDVAPRLDAKQDLYDAPNQCSVFRPWQGWTALSSTGPREGTLQVFPMITLAAAYIMLRPFFALRAGAPAHSLAADDWVLDLESTEFPGSVPRKAQELNSQSHPHLCFDKTLVSIPRVEPGDQVYWHCDVVHAVESEHRGAGDSSVLYIPAVPLTEKNAWYLRDQRASFARGVPSPDFPGGEGESQFVGRIGVDDITGVHTRRMFGLAPFEQPADASAGERNLIEAANRILFEQA